MLIHHVFFFMPPDATAEQVEQLKAGLETLTSIDGIKQYHIGVPADTDRPVIDRSYAISWLLIFEDAQAEAHYQDHPVHHAFVESCKHLWNRVVVYDSVDA
jgi:hypothetical protein